MPTRPPVHKPRAPSGRTAAQLYDRARGSAAARGYDRTWQKLRSAHLDEHPLCAECLKEERIVAAEEVDHIVPIEVAPERRLDPTNLRSLCKPHHSAKTARERWEANAVR